MMRIPRLYEQFIAIDPAPTNTGMVVHLREDNELYLYHGRYEEEIFPLLEKIVMQRSTLIICEDSILFGKARSNVVGIFIKEQLAVLRYAFQERVWTPFPRAWKKHFKIPEKKPTQEYWTKLLSERGIDKLNGLEVCQKKQHFPQDIIDATFILFFGEDLYADRISSRKSKRNAKSD